MADTNTIKEFLVGIGFKLDEQGLRQTKRVLGEVTTAFQQLGHLVTSVTSLATRSFVRMVEVVTGTSGGLIYAVERTAHSFFNLYFATQRIGASASNLMAFRYAGRQLGLGLNEIETQAQSLFRAIRTTPGIGLMLGGIFGVSPRDAQGRLRDTTETTLAIARKYYEAVRANSPLRFMYQQALASAGYDEESMFRIGQQAPNLQRFKTEYLKRLKDAGLDPAQVAGNSTKAIQALNSVLATLEVVWDRIVADLMPTLQTGLGSLDKFLQSHIGEITDFFHKTVTGILDWVKSIDWQAIGEGIKTAFLWLISQDWKALGATLKELGSNLKAAVVWMTEQDTLTGLSHFKELLITLAAAVVGLAGAFRVLGKVPMVFALMEFLGFVAKHGMPGTEGFRPGESLTPQGATPETPSEIERQPGESWWGYQWRRAKQRLGIGRSDYTAPKVPQLGTAEGKARTKQAMDYFMSQEGGGYTRDQAAGLVANLISESSLRTNAVGDNGQAYGLGQWHPDRQADFERVFHHSIKTATYAEQLAFVHWELMNTRRRADERLRAAQSGGEAGRAISQFYEAPLDPSGAVASSRGDLANRVAREHQADTAVPGPQSSAIDNLRRTTAYHPTLGDASSAIHHGNIDNSRPVNVAGAQVTIHAPGGDPTEVGRSVRVAMDRSNADLVRNLRGAMAESA
jgi:hypothetical protein